MKSRNQNDEVGIAVVVHGKEVDEFPHNDRKTYIWARSGTEYGIVVWNFTNVRAEAVITVDGLDIIKGKVGDYRTQTGYVIDAHSKPQPIPGFKLDGDTAARFTFGNPGQSYAARMDKPNNIGVIGAAFFLEQYRIAFRGGSDSLRGGDFLSMGGGMKSMGGEGLFRGASVGTGFGRQTDFHTSRTSFTRATTEPYALLAIHYHTQERLAEMGIDVRKPSRPQVADGPNPFPGATDGCPPPSGWDPRGKR